VAVGHIIQLGGLLAARGLDTHAVEDIALNKKKSNTVHEVINIHAIRIFNIW
jgi:hypothetical protein